MADTKHKTPAAANKDRGELELLAGDVRYVLRWNIAALCAVEARAGRSFAALLNGSTLGSVSDRLALFWAGLQAYHGEEIQTFEQAMALLEGAAGTLLVDALLLLKQTIKDLQDVSQPPPKLVAEVGRSGPADPPTAQAGIGIDSSSKPDAPA